jgi:hypothetical protein
MASRFLERSPTPELSTTPSGESLLIGHQTSLTYMIRSNDLIIHQYDQHIYLPPERLLKADICNSIRFKKVLR